MTISGLFSVGVTFLNVMTLQLLDHLLSSYDLQV